MDTDSWSRPGGCRSPAAWVLVDVERTNVRLGHENRGALSPMTGFLPRQSPQRSFSRRYAVWDRLAAQLPALYRNLTVRSAVGALPVLTAGPDELPEQELPRAATVLGSIAHAYVHQSPDSAPRLPASITDPWTQVLHRLGRPAELVLSYQDLILNNWVLRRPGKPPSVLRLADLDLLVPTAGNQEERVFYLTQLEIISRCGPVVGAVARAQDAVVVRDPDLLREALAVIEQALLSVNRVSLRQIDARADAVTHVEPVRWAKTVAPLAVPFRPGVLGPSGTASPIMNLLDAFFGRPRHDSQLGREILAHRASYPPHWQQLLTAVEAVPVGAALSRGAGRAATQQYEAALEAYTGEDGFLGRHRRKVYGYLAVAFTVGRGLTIGGFAGPPQARRWDNVDRALSASGAERRADAAIGVAVDAGAPTGPHRAPDPAEPQWPDVTVAELARHNDPEHGWWIAVDGTVYDVTEFLRRHPGGAPILQAYAGLDATAAFARAHRAAGGAVRLRRHYAIARLGPPPEAEPGSAYEFWAGMLRHAVELQNTFRLDRSFLRHTRLVDSGAAAASPFQCDRAEDLHARFAGDYLPALRSQLLTRTTAAMKDGLTLTPAVRGDGVARPVDLRERLDDLQDQLAAGKQILVDILTAVTEKASDESNPELAAVLGILQSWLHAPSMPEPVLVAV